MKKWELSRRTFLRGAGYTIALPMLEAMIPRVANAQTNPMKVAFIYWPNGVPSDDRVKPFAPLVTALADVRADYTLVHGMRSQAYDDQENTQGFDADAHGAAHVTIMTAQKPSVTVGNPNVQMKISIDQVIANAVGAASRFPSMGINVQTKGLENVVVQHAPIYSECLYWKNATTPVKLYNSPLELYNLMFSGGTTPSPTPMTDPAILRKKSILDFVIGDIKSLNSRLGAKDKQRVDEYLTSLERIQRDIASIPTAPGGGMCVPMNTPANIAYTMATYEQRLNVMQDLMVKAFQCDMTRVFDFMLGHECMTSAYIPNLTAGNTWHDWSHLGDESNSYDESTTTLVWHTNKFKQLINKMKAVTMPTGGNLLDQSLLVFHSEFGQSTAHVNGNMHFVLAGKGGNRYKTGQTLSLANDVGDLWLTIAKDMGVNINTFGQYGTKVLTQVKV